MTDARTWVAEHGAALIGAAGASAVDAVSAAGLVPRSAGPDTALTMEHRPQRVTLVLDADGAVQEVRAG